jgi:imidazolonepropionase-like amidohydrolase
MNSANKLTSFQAATAHSFHLSEELALQSVTSVPAKSLEIDHRVGYARAGYDADLVVWDFHRRNSYPSLH